jgi:colanic acid/amylovoran biosynthesis glycosyltransferase
MVDISNVKTVYFFTHSFPFNKEGETYVNNEFNYLSEKFDKIVIIPLLSQTNDLSFPFSERVIVLKPLIKGKWHHYLFGFFGFKGFKVYLNEFFMYQVYRSRKNFLSFISDYCTTNIVLSSKIYKQLINNAGDRDVCYFYWGKGCVNSLVFSSNIKFKSVARFHGGDLYDCNYDGYIPLQSEILKKLDLACFISNHGERYLKARFPNVIKKTVVSYLGTEDNGISIKSEDGILRIVSCSNVVPEKRVSLILDALELTNDLKVEWTHIGDGIDFDLLKSRAFANFRNFRVIFLGRLSNDQVFDFYRSNPVDVFVNVSTTEGLPVSIMEAISFNIPVIATNVGGTSEIVNVETGILLSSNPTPNDLCDALSKIRFLNLEPRNFWLQNFTASKNYSEFISTLEQLMLEGCGK